jgi:DNA-binding response OmpR family regulator
MPQVDGLELLAWVKGQSHFRNVSFVLLTSSNNEADRSWAKDLGADDYLVKATRVDELARVLRGVLERWCGNPKPGLEGQDQRRSA